MGSLRVRARQPERMDALDLRTDILTPALRRVSAVTRRLGGLAAIRVAVRAEAASSVLDVGTGNLFVPRALREELGPRLGRVVGVDSHADVVRVAADGLSREDDICLVRADGRALPFADDAFDVVVSTLTLHHLDERDATIMLAEMGRVARQRIVVWDLERSLHGLAGATLLAWTLWRRDPLVRHDGPLSVRKAYRKREILRMAGDAGLRDMHVRRRPGHMLLTARPPTGARGTARPPAGETGVDVGASTGNLHA